ncbi:hypothetical protein I4U23_009095 [Adineta vaga]|nr:hypothetical protein I4U23_009095 [Adineta vaga]
MTLSIITAFPKRRVLPVIIILSFILIVIILLRQEQQQQVSLNFVDISALSPVTEQNSKRRNDLNARIHQPVSLALLRGLLVFYPHDQEVFFLPELLWFYRSWLEMMKDEPLSWRTDLIVYTGVYTSALQQLGCVYNRIRMDKNEPPQCRVFLYQRVHLRSINDVYKNANTHSYQQIDRNRSILLIQNLRTYVYLDSINIIAECYPSFAMYDYILRTDLDVFLTKNFGHFVPYNDTILVGQGGYSSVFTANRLRRIAKNIDWLYANITNIGSTWYGPPRVAQRIANYSLEAMLHLAMNEFTKPEREGKFGTALWPEWHYGVLLLYSCDMAINHLVLKENINIGLAYNLLDQFSTKTDPYDIEKNNRLHIHCWHTQDRFSKFLFKEGKYNHIHPRTLIHDTSAAGYTLRLALESRLMSFDGLRQALLNAKNLSNV